MNQPIFITGVERSGSSMIAKILDICGVFHGSTTKMYENYEIHHLIHKYINQTKINGELILDDEHIPIPIDWKRRIEDILKCEGYKDGPWMVKGAIMSQTWPLWYFAYPNARWIIVRRRTGDVIQSCVKTGYMTLFKDTANQQLVNSLSEEEGWKWWIHEHEKRFVHMIETGLNCKVIWPERMVIGDYQQIYETLEWLGLKWDSKIVEIIDPMLNKSRRKTQWHT